MKIDHHHSTAGSHGVLLSSLGCVVILTSLARALALGAEEAVPPEFAGKIMPTEMRDDVNARAAGKDIYEGKVNPAVNCARCHGNDGKPTKLGKGAPDLSDPAMSKKHSDARWFWRISEKKSGSKMPGYKGKLSEEQLWQVIAYLRILAQSGR